MKPYNDIEITDEYIIREFDDTVDPVELMWHRDREDRKILSLTETDWKIQLDNDLPVSMDLPIFIPKGEWHRLIKGSGVLRLKIFLS